MDRRTSTVDNNNKKPSSAFKYISLSAFTLSLLECVAGIVCCVLYLVYHNCGLKVKNATEGSFQELGLAFYTSYIAGGNCTYSDNEQDVDIYNPNNLTKADNIVIWQIVYLVLYILWAFTCALLLKSLRKPGLFVTPWLVATALMLVADLVFTALSLTDLSKKSEVDTLPQGSYKDHYMMKTLMLVLYCCKLGIFWLINLVFFSMILLDLIHQRKAERGSSSLWTDKNYDDIRSELSSQEGEVEEDDDENQPEMTTEFRGEPQKPMSNGINGGIPRQQEQLPEKPRYNGQLPEQPPRYNGQLPAAHDNQGYQPDDEDELRKPKSFKDRVKETKDNKMNVGSGGMYSYVADPPVIPSYKSNAPSQDVDNAFGFLSNYDDRPRDAPRVSRVVGGRRVYDRDEDDPFYIPKV